MRTLGVAEDAGAGTLGSARTETGVVRPYRGKRVFDLVVVLCMAPLALALAAAIAVAVKLDSKGPVLFSQRRVGRGGRPFWILKFRTMKHSQQEHATFPDPASITRIGALLRQLSLDELPQLWNVARGQMSVVGPRPTLAYQVERYDERQRARLAVRPGITGLAQVRGRTAITWSERIEFDLAYLTCQSPILDGRIVISTVAAILTRRGIDETRVDDPLAQLDD